MRRNNTVAVKSIVEEILQKNKLDNKLKEVRLIKNWEFIVGKIVANATTNLYIKNRCLFIHLSSSVVRSELQMLQTTVIEAVNKYAGEKIVEKVVLR
ncbi:MAG: DUF721 domain-containing protein [Bacteroidetes bacterium]|jgi:hypothetical protein|nr:DUF721 domain-containing protein [Bacteroidota bacterium]MBT6685946.1 DUF721 domain-containing protein [Bacteroidota bacterium]MBT7144454.1 DUF721 domain-containing protein [Bacteroidota bacterium]MBT7490827.1 DUF721 domain-containing protein [Bacteroidota bacterium]